MSNPPLQRHLPDDMHKARKLPGVLPETGPWLHRDAAYGAQMARRIALMRTRAAEVLYLEEGARAAALELLDQVLADLPRLGFAPIGPDCLRCPDGRVVAIDRDAPLRTLGHLVQNDFVLMQKRGDQHVLTGAVLCFPASWRLDEKAGRPLVDIHVPVPEYDGDLARRVQRLFDGVRAGQPLWRFNQLWYEDPELFQPRSVHAPRRVGADHPDSPFYRSERQTLVRLPRSDAVVFAIHTYVLRRADVPDSVLAG